MSGRVSSRLKADNAMHMAQVVIVGHVACRLISTSSVCISCATPASLFSLTDSRVGQLAPVLVRNQSGSSIFEPDTVSTVTCEISEVSQILH